VLPSEAHARKESQRKDHEQYCLEHNDPDRQGPQLQQANDSRQDKQKLPEHETPFGWWNTGETWGDKKEEAPVTKTINGAS
jgi:hypothetical protein